MISFNVTLKHFFRETSLVLIAYSYTALHLCNRNYTDFTKEYYNSFVWSASRVTESTFKCYSRGWLSANANTVGKCQLILRGVENMQKYDGQCSPESKCLLHHNVSGIFEVCNQFKIWNTTVLPRTKAHKIKASKYHFLQRLPPACNNQKITPEPRPHTKRSTSQKAKKSKMMVRERWNHSEKLDGILSDYIKQFLKNVFMTLRGYGAGVESKAAPEIQEEPVTGKRQDVWLISIFWSLVALNKSNTTLMCLMF